jgi:hypothetical protein
MTEQATLTVNVYIRNVTVHDDHDVGPAKGEFDISFVTSASPVSSDPSSRSGTRWTGTVTSGATYDVDAWTGPATIAAGRSLLLAGAGEEQDRFRNDALRGGLTYLSAEQGWGAGRWWRTTNGKDFDFLFYVARVEGEASPGVAGAPDYPGASADAPGPGAPTQDEYFAAFGAPLDNA